MVYRSASQRPLPNQGASANRNYLRRGIDHRTAHARRLLGVPPTVAAGFANSPAETDLAWLAHTFSVTGLRALAARRLTGPEMTLLKELAQRDVSRLRGYVSQTTLGVRDIHWLMEREVSARQVKAWVGRLPVLAQASTNLANVLSTATVVHGVPDGHVAGWVRFANRFEVRFEPSSARWTFLGGDTALLASAGMSPAEATRTVRSGEVDRSGLAVLAALRGARL